MTFKSTSPTLPGGRWLEGCDGSSAGALKSLREHRTATPGVAGSNPAHRASKTVFVGFVLLNLRREANLAVRRTAFRFGTRSSILRKVKEIQNAKEQVGRSWKAHRKPAA